MPFQGFAYDPAASKLPLAAEPCRTGLHLYPPDPFRCVYLRHFLADTPKDVLATRKTMLLLMPIMIGWMSLNFPSGLVIYWIVCNLYQLVQQTIMYS